MSKQDSPLTEKQLRFIDEYLVDRNATQAYLRAGYRVNAATAAVNGSQLLRNPKIKSAIEQQEARRRAKNEDKVQRWIEETSRLAFCDPRRLYTELGTLLPIYEWPADLAACISQLEFDSGILVKVRFWDKNAALKTLGQHLGILAEKLQIEAKSLEELLVASYQATQRRDSPGEEE